MPITFPISLPSPEFKSTAVSITAQNVVAMLEAPFSLIQQTQKFGGERWVMTITVAPQKRLQAERVVAALLSLQGRWGTCYAGDTANRVPGGSAGGTPRVNGAATPFSYDLVTKGWPASTNGILLRGDWIQIGTDASRKLHKVLADANSDGSGNASLLIWPACRNFAGGVSYADNLSIVTTNPTGVFRLAADQSFDIDLIRIYGLQAGFVEAT